MTNQTNQKALGGHGALWTAALLSLGLAVVGVVSSWWSTMRPAADDGAESSKDVGEVHNLHQETTGVQMTAGQRTAERPGGYHSANEAATTESAASVTASQIDLDSDTTATITSKSTSTPPSSPTRQKFTSSKKGKKWRDRLSAKKQNKLKQHEKLRGQGLQQ